MLNLASRRTRRRSARAAGPRYLRLALVAAMAAAPIAAVAAGAQAQDGASPSGDETPTVTLSKTYHPRNPDPAPGEEITFTVTLANESAVDATGYRVDGTLPPEVVDASWTCFATGAESACGAASGSGRIADTADVGAHGTVVYVLTGTIADDSSGQFTQAVTLVPGPGQACEPVATRTTAPAPATPTVAPTASPGEPAEQDSYGQPGGYQYYSPSPAPAGEAMTCRVNNHIAPSVVDASSDDGAAPGTGTLAETGVPLTGFTLGGTSLIVLGGAMLWLTRRRAQPHRDRHSGA